MIEVLIPHMPTTKELLPYLRAIDDTRVYTNGGPLVCKLEERLSREVLNDAEVCCVANGTVSLELLLMALLLTGRVNRSRHYVLTQAVTFKATRLAIDRVGCLPYVVDVEPMSWLIDPVYAGRAAEFIRYKMMCAMPVATFGAPVNDQLWGVFAEEFSVPVIIDAAGALMDQHVGASHKVHYSFSMHATKYVGAGEGGVVATRDSELMKKVRELANFGSGGTNAKMSEYAAAVGLASLDLARRKEERTQQMRDLYIRYLPRDCVVQMNLARHHTLMPVLLPEHVNATAVQLSLDSAGIQTRRWYEPILDYCPMGLCYSSMDVTNAIRERMLGLPFHMWLTDDDIRTVCKALEHATA